MCAEPHRKIGERSLEILESAIDREDLLVDCAPLRDGQAGRVLRRHIRAVLVAKCEPQGHDVWPRRLTRDGAPDVVFPARRRVLVEDQLRRRRRPRALIRRLGEKSGLSYLLLRP